MILGYINNMSFQKKLEAQLRVRNIIFEDFIKKYNRAKAEEERLIKELHKAKPARRIVVNYALINVRNILEAYEPIYKDFKLLGKIEEL